MKVKVFIKKIQSISDNVKPFIEVFKVVKVLRKRD